jgi:hypothetical protein
MSTNPGAAYIMIVQLKWNNYTKKTESKIQELGEKGQHCGEYDTLNPT